MERTLRSSYSNDVNNPSLHLIVGHPIAHSLSPLIYNTLYRKYKLAISCMKIDVAPANIASFFDVLLGLDIAAMNFTIPHKTLVLPYIDSVDKSVEVLNSINALAVDGNYMTGTSTDGEGFSLSAKEKGITLAGKRIFVYGYGGASAAIVKQAIDEKCASIIVSGRDRHSADILCDMFSGFGVPIISGELEDIAEIGESVDIFINTTPLGMSGTNNDFENFEFIEHLKKTAVVCDIVYKPAETKLIKAAQECGLKTLGGIGMLVWQALAAFNFFYDIKPTPEDKELIVNELKKQGYKF